MKLNISRERLIFLVVGLITGVLLLTLLLFLFVFNKSKSGLKKGVGKGGKSKEELSHGQDSADAPSKNKKKTGNKKEDKKKDSEEGKKSETSEKEEKKEGKNSESSEKGDDHSIEKDKSKVKDDLHSVEEVKSKAKVKIDNPDIQGKGKPVLKAVAKKHPTAMTPHDVKAKRKEVVQPKSEIDTGSSHDMKTNIFKIADAQGKLTAPPINNTLNANDLNRNPKDIVEPTLTFAEYSEAELKDANEVASKMSRAVISLSKNSDVCIQSEDLAKFCEVVSKEHPVFYKKHFAPMIETDDDELLDEWTFKGKKHATIGNLMSTIYSEKSSYLTRLTIFSYLRSVFADMTTKHSGEEASASSILSIVIDIYDKEPLIAFLTLSLFPKSVFNASGEVDDALDELLKRIEKMKKKSSLAPLTLALPIGNPYRQRLLSNFEFEEIPKDSAFSLLPSTFKQTFEDLKQIPKKEGIEVKRFLLETFSLTSVRTSSTLRILQFQSFPMLTLYSYTRFSMLPHLSAKSLKLDRQWRNIEKLSILMTAGYGHPKN